MLVVGARRVQQLVGVDDEVAGVGVVDRGLGLGLPGLVGLVVARIGADEFDFREIAEFDARDVLQFTADHDMKKLLVRD